MTAQDLASLIAIRNYAVSTMDNLYVKLSKEEVKILANKIAQLEKHILYNMLELEIK